MKISNKMIKIKIEIYEKRLKEIEDFPVQLIPEITNFIEIRGIQSVSTFQKQMFLFPPSPPNEKKNKNKKGRTFFS